MAVKTSTFYLANKNLNPLQQSSMFKWNEEWLWGSDLDTILHGDDELSGGGLVQCSLTVQEYQVCPAYQVGQALIHLIVRGRQRRAANTNTSASSTASCLEIHNVTLFLV